MDTVEQTFQDVWRSAVSNHAHRTFLVFRDEGGSTTEWTYAAFDDVVSRTAGVLAAAGVTRGASIHVALRNCPAFVAVWLAASRLGAWLVPVDPASASREIANQVSRVLPVVGICAASRSETYWAGVGDTSATVLELAEDAADLEEAGALYGAPAAHAEVEPSDRLAVMFTSGTTSQPKGVVLTQANYAYVARTMAEAAGLHRRHRWHVALPLFHANAQYYCFSPAISVGGSVALSAGFSASRWVSHTRELGATHASLFASPIRMILSRTSPTEQPLELEHVWFAQNLGAEHYEEFARWAGCRPRQLYGMTETVAIVCADNADVPRHDVIGTPVPGRRVTISEPGRDGAAEPGVPGEITVGGTKGVDLFAGYLDDETTTTHAFSRDEQGTWFRTGDLAVADPDGILRFVGRIDDVIKVSGENVSLTEVEAAIAEAPGVLEAVVVARFDPVRDAVPVAYVVPRDPARPPQAADLSTWAERRLAPAARPRAWNVIPDLPRTSVGKVQRSRVTAIVDDDDGGGRSDPAQG